MFTVSIMSDASDRQPCQRCSGSGFYRSYGSCFRCEGSGMVSMAKISAYFRATTSAVATAPAPTPASSAAIGKNDAIAAAKAAASDLKAAGFKGRIRVLDQRIELLARTTARPGETLHLTWHPRGQDKEWLAGTPAKHWPHILR